MRVVLIDRQHTDKVFPLATKHLKRIPGLCDRYNLKDVRTEITGGFWQLWLMIDEKIEGVLLTTIIQYPKKRELHLIGLSGYRMKEWTGLHSVIEKYGRDEGCDSMFLVGARKGLSRVFPEYGKTRLLLEKEL